WVDAEQQAYDDDQDQRAAAELHAAAADGESAAAGRSHAGSILDVLAFAHVFESHVGLLAWCAKGPSRLERAIEERQTHVHPVVDVRVIVVEFLVRVTDAGLRKSQRQEPRPVMDVVLVAPAAVDIDALERAQRPRIAADEQHWVVGEPALPARFYQLAGLEIERQAEAQRRARIGIVGRRHAQVHDRVPFSRRELLLAPDGREEALDAAAG